jgi:hypothetical protein
MKNKGLVFLGIILGIVFFVIGFVYTTHSAGSLPGYFPGFEAASSHKHVKHAIASFVVGAACFIVAWFQSAPKKI